LQHKEYVASELENNKPLKKILSLLYDDYFFAYYFTSIVGTNSNIYLMTIYLYFGLSYCLIPEKRIPYVIYALNENIHRKIEEEEEAKFQMLLPDGDTLKLNPSLFFDMCFKILTMAVITSNAIAFKNKCEKNKKKSEEKSKIRFFMFAEKARDIVLEVPKDKKKITKTYKSNYEIGIETMASMLRVISNANSEENMRIMQAVFLTPQWFELEELNISAPLKAQDMDSELIIKRQIMDTIYDFLYEDLPPIKNFMDLLSHKPLLGRKSTQQDYSLQEMVKEQWIKLGEKKFEQNGKGNLSWIIFIGHLSCLLDDLCYSILRVSEDYSPTEEGEFTFEGLKNKLIIDVPNENFLNFLTKKENNENTTNEEDIVKKFNTIDMYNLIYHILDAIFYNLKKVDELLDSEYQNKVSRCLNYILKNCFQVICVYNTYKSFNDNYKYGKPYYYIIQFLSNLSPNLEENKENRKSLSSKEIYQKSNEESFIKTFNEMKYQLLKDIVVKSPTNKNQDSSSDSEKSKEDKDNLVDNKNNTFTVFCNKDYMNEFIRMTNEGSEKDFYDIGFKKMKKYYFKVLKDISEVKIDFNRDTLKESYKKLSEESKCIPTLIDILNTILSQLYELIINPASNEEETLGEKQENILFLKYLFNDIRKLAYFIYTDNNPQIHENYSIKYIELYYLLFFNKEVINSKKDYFRQNDSIKEEFFPEKTDKKGNRIDEKYYSDKLEYDPKSISAKILKFLSKFEKENKNYTSLLFEKFIRSKDKSYTSLDDRYYGLFLHHSLLDNPLKSKINSIHNFQTDTFAFKRLLSNDYFKKMQNDEKIKRKVKKSKENFAEFLFKLLNTCKDDFDEAATILCRVMNGSDDFFDILSKSPVLQDQLSGNTKAVFGIGL
ncbi:MAG: hypothetical protein MJ252_10550, partial [archaeon]|nr:hypothetical protein [archaeon]